jgi:hypothetical protein
MSHHKDLLVILVGVAGRQTCDACNCSQTLLPLGHLTLIPEHVYNKCNDVIKGERWPSD